MSWVCCNSCFQAPGPDRQLAVTTCGHVICSLCFQKGKQGECIICKAKCQVSPLSDKSSAEVKAMFSDINVVAAKHFAEIGKVITFQARHQKKLLAHYQQRNEKLEEICVKMKQEMQQMAMKLKEQSAYITKLENLQHQRDEWMDVDGRSLFRKPDPVPRLSLISPPQDGRMGTIPQRSTSQPSTSQQSTPQRSTSQQSTPQRSTSQQSTPQRSTSQRSTFQPSTPQRSTSQRSTFQPSTPQRSTIQNALATHSTHSATVRLCATLSRINARKAAGPDGIPGRVLRPGAGQLTEVLSDIFNLSLAQAAVPTCF
ncbi:putative E3 SUMO-protein ligase RNF212 [Diretmus argenteus]